MFAQVSLRLFKPCWVARIPLTIGMAKQFLSLVLITPMTLNSRSTVALDVGRQMRMETSLVRWGKRGASAVPNFDTEVQNFTNGVEEFVSANEVCRSRPHSASMEETLIPRDWKEMATWQSAWRLLPPKMFRGSTADTFLRVFTLSGRRAWIWRAISNRKSLRRPFIPSSSAGGKTLTPSTSNLYLKEKRGVWLNKLGDVHMDVSSTFSSTFFI